MEDGPLTEERFEGFSQEYADFPDYILKITEAIWEGRGIGSLNRLYAPDIPMRFPSGVSMGNQATIDGTMATLAEFPDRTLLGEDVVWCGNAHDGYLSSHRLVSTATHTGRGPFSEVYGTTGRPIRMRAIADCAAKGDVIYDEWLIRDTGALVRQLGGDPETYAEALIAMEGGSEKAVAPLTPDSDVAGDYVSRGNENGWGKRYAHVLERMMDKDFDIVRREYDRAVHLALPGGRDGLSWGDAEHFWLSLRSSFPRSEFAVHHVIGRDDPMLGPRAAVRWSLWGEHSGWGTFGRPTGAKVYVMGISHAEFGPWGLRRETVLIDEVAVWKQILMHEDRPPMVRKAQTEPALV